MGQKTRAVLRNYFETGDKPTQAEFYDLIDSYFNLQDDDGLTLKNVINVAKEGGDFDSVKLAMDSITDNSILNPYTILVAPGNYIENNPIQCKEWVSVRSLGGSFVTSLSCMNVGFNMFDLVDRVVIKGINVFGVLSTAYAFSMEVAGIVGLIDNINYKCSNGIFVNHADANVLVTNHGEFNEITTTNKSLYITAGNVTVNGYKVAGATGITTAVEVDGANSFLQLDNFESASANVATALKFINGCFVKGSINDIKKCNDGMVLSGSDTEVRMDVLKMHQCVNDGFRIDNSGTGIFLAMFATTVSECGGLNFNVLNANCSVVGNGFTEIKNSYVIEGAKFYAYLLDLSDDDEGLNIFGELHVGTPENPAESVMGEGDSYTRGMLVYTYNGIAYVDVTAEAQSASGSTFAFSNVNANTAIYVASTREKDGDVLKHYGIKTKVNTAGVMGVGSIVCEYWAGLSWVDVNVMEAQSGGQYYPYANQIFQHTGSHQIRIDSELHNDSWTKNDPMSLGDDYYWIRYRIVTGITTAPVFEQFKVHSNRFEVNGDGWPEFFGKSRPIGRLPWALGLLEAAASSPGNQDLFISDNIDVGRVENKFANGAVDRIGFSSYLPLDLDTSSPIKLLFSIITDDTSAGDIDWVIRWGFTADGFSVYRSQIAAPTTGVNEQSLAESEAAPAAADTQLTYEFLLDVSNMVSRKDAGFGDVLWATIERVGNVDTHSGDVSMIAIAGFYTKWCEGGHI